MFTATLSDASQGVTTIHTDQGDITIADGATTGTLTIASGNGEDVYSDASSLTAHITGVSGGNFESLGGRQRHGDGQRHRHRHPGHRRPHGLDRHRGRRRQLRVHGDAVERLGRRHHHPHRPGRHHHRRRRHHRHADHCLGQRRGRLQRRLQPDGAASPASPAATSRASSSAAARRRPTSPTPSPRPPSTSRPRPSPRAPAPATCSRRRCRTPRKASPPSTPTRATSRIADGATTGTLTIASGNGEDVYSDASSLTAHITGVSGGNFESLVVGSGTATANVTDTVTAATVDLTASTVTEGAGANYVFTATLSNASQGVTTIHTDQGDITHRRRRDHRHADDCLGQRRGRLQRRLAA